MDDEADNCLLLSSDHRKSEFKVKKLQQNRAANALFFGVVLGFVFSFLFAYSGVFDESNQIDYSIYDFMSMATNNKTVEVKENTNLAELLYKHVRVMCIVMTKDESITNQGPFIMDTWGKRCNSIIFFSDKPNANLTNIVVLKETDPFERLRAAMKYIYTNHMDKFDWIFKSNDNSYIILENLRHLLYQYETDWPLLIGQRYLKEDYMIGVYAISKRAFTRVIEDGFTNKNICEERGSDMDKEITFCMNRVNVIKVDGIDRTGRGQFFANNPESALFPTKFDDYDKWYWHKLKQGIENCCSDRLVALQNHHSTHLLYLEYFIYKVHAFGRHRKREELPQKLSLQDVIRTNY